MMYVLLITSCFVDASIFAYYAVSVLSAKKSKLTVFLIMAGTIGIVGSVVRFFEALPLIQPFAAIVTVTLLLVLLFTDKYWKRFLLMLSYLALTLVVEQVVNITTNMLVGFWLNMPFFEVDPDSYTILAAMFASLLLINFIIVKFVAIPLWHKRLRFIRHMNAATMALFTGMLALGVANMNTLSQQLGDETDLLLAWGFLAFIVCSAAFVVFYVRNAYRQSKKDAEATLIKEQFEQQIAYYSEMAGRYNKLRKLKHDFDNHMQVITTLNMSGKYEETQQYLERLSNEFVSIDGVGFCGDPAIDAILYYKREAMLSYGIRVDYRVTLPVSCPVDAFDLCAIMSNLLDNAFEACLAVGGGDPSGTGRFVELETKERAGYFAIVMRNTFSPHNNDSEKNDAGDTEDGHQGLGTKIIAGIARKYDGDTLFEAHRKGMFISVVSLKLQGNVGVVGADDRLDLKELSDR